VNVIRRSVTRQSQVVVNSAEKVVISGQVAGLSMPIARDKGSQKTLRPYDMPMQR
jgi:hypothetical protein